MKGWRERAADVFAEQGSIAAKMKSAPATHPNGAVAKRFAIFGN